MSDSRDQSDIIADTNVDSVLSRLLLKTKDFTGDGLVEVIRTFLARAEEIRDKHRSLDASGQKWLAESGLPDVDEVKGGILDGWYETTCLKWFLARACERLAEELWHSVDQSQKRMRRIVEIDYADDGQVDSFLFETRTDPAAGQ
jgi:hypothetical protein